MLKTTVKIIVGVIIMFGLVVSASACAEKPEPEYAGSIAEGILLALNDSNYAKYCEHFGQTMREVVTEDVFNQTESLLKAKIGDYVSKEFWKVEEQGIFAIVYYKAKFTKESGDVVVKVVFQEIEEEMYVSGLWFDSPKLRE